MKFKIKVYHTMRYKWFFISRTITYLGSTYKVDTPQQLWQVCEWAAKRGYETRVTKMDE